MDYNLLFACVAGIVILLLLIIKVKVHAFPSLLISSISVGIIAGMPAGDIFSAMQEGMGNTLGFVAVLIGLGAMLGGILEHTGSAQVLAHYILEKTGLKNAPAAMATTGFLLSIPVFFDVAFIILVPVVYALQKDSGKSLLYYALPLLTGLAATHVFIPPTPGPVAVCEILGAEIGWVILMGIIVSIPVVIIAGLLFGGYISKRLYLEAPEFISAADEQTPPSAQSVLFIILLPIVLIVSGTLVNSFEASLLDILPGYILYFLQLIGHPFSALIIANLVVWYWLGIRRGLERDILKSISSNSMGPAGIIILLTGAGGVLKQILIDTGAASMLASYFSELGLGVLFFAYLSALLIRVLQGSATVAMITAAGLIAPLIVMESTNISKALLVLAVAAGSTALSHVNDSGFWLVSKYLGMDEKQTFKSWTSLTGLLSISAFLIILVLHFLLV